MPRLTLPNATYFITSTTFRRKKWFAEPDLARIVVDQWKHYQIVHGFRLHTYTVLHDHDHVILEVGAEKSISQTLHAVNSYTTTLVNKHFGRDRKLKIWQGDAWDEVVRDEDMYWQKVAYTLLNPWRAGLVNDPLSRYPFSDIGEWLDREGEEFLLDLFSRYKRWSE